MTVQNLQLLLIAGMIVGFVVGVLVAAYLIVPMTNGSSFGMLIAVATPIIGIFLGSRVTLAMVAR